MVLKFCSFLFYCFGSWCEISQSTPPIVLLRIKYSAKVCLESWRAFVDLDSDTSFYFSLLINSTPRSSSYTCVCIENVYYRVVCRACLLHSSNPFLGKQSHSRWYVDLVPKFEIGLLMNDMFEIGFVLVHQCYMVHSIDYTTPLRTHDLMTFYLSKTKPKHCDCPLVSL